jgi:hypothetical protein
VRITQLAFDFTFPVKPRSERQQRASWRVVALARRHRISPNQAALYASEMRLPVEVRQ